MSLRPRARASTILLFVTVFGAHAYFYNGVAWNQSARLDAIYSFVEPGTPDTGSFRINRFIAAPNPGNTGDWALYQGNYYSNKAPGGTFLAIPLYFALFHVEKTMGIAPSSFGAAVFNAYALNLWSSVFWTSLGAVGLFGLFTRAMGFSPRDALFGTLTYAFGTLIFPFDSQLWGLPTATAFLIIGHSFLTKPGRGPAVGAGAFIGMALLTEYLTLVSVVLALVYLVWQRTRRADVPFFVLGASPLIACLLLYQKLHFGGWFVTAAALSNPILEGADFQRFSPTVFWNLLLSLNRGALVFMPILCLALWNVLRGGWASTNDRRFFLICALNVAAYVFTVSCYRGWHGGNATGPRYLIPSLPFWCLLLPPISSLKPAARMAATLVTAWSVLNMLVIAAVDTMILSSIHNPLYGELYPRFWQGRFSRQVDPFYVFDTLTPEQAGQGVFNLGRLVHLQGAVSTLPLLAFLVISVWLLVKLSGSAALGKDRRK